MKSSTSSLTTLVSLIMLITAIHVPTSSALIPNVRKISATSTTASPPLPCPSMTMKTDCGGMSRRQMASAVSSIFLAGMIGGGATKKTIAADGSPPPTAPPIDKSVLLGTYTDPINHPGGTRTIEFQDSPLSNFGGYQLATVKGGGGRGEPKSFELPAMIFECPGNKQVLTRAPNSGKLCITIDFTPKGGPKDFTGYYDDGDASNPGIRFILDNNFWPKVK